MSFLKNKVFLRVLCLFLAVVIGVFTFLSVIKILGEKTLDAAAVENLNIEFENGAKGVQRVFSQIRYAMSELSVDLAASSEFADGTYINKNDVRADMRSVFIDRRQNEFSGYIASAFIVNLSKPGYVYELAETVSSETFFNQRFVSDVYTGEFWNSRIANANTFGILRSAVFSETQETKRVETELLPVVYKPYDDGKYIIVMLLDVKSLIEKYGFSGIYTNDGDVICSGESGESISREEFFSKKLKKKNNVLLQFKDEQNGDIYIIKTLDKSEVDAEKKSFGITMDIVMAGFFLLVLCLLGYILLKGSVSLRDILDELNETSFAKSTYKDGITSFKEVVNTVKFVTSQCSPRPVEPRPGDSVLNSLFLQSKMRDVYVAIDDVENKVSTNSPFFYMVFCRINYTHDFEKYVEGDTGKATFLLKQLLEMHIDGMGVSATTLQIEKDAVVIVFDASSEGFDIRKNVDLVLAKLSNESEYAFFTIAVSQLCSGEENIKSVYDGLVDLSRYGRPLAETQVLFLGVDGKDGRKFYFSVEEMGKLTSLLRNGNGEDVVRLVNEILEFNIKKGINRFEMSLLCMEIINCGVKLLNRLFHTAPQSIDVTLAYRKMEKAYTLDEYVDICVGFLQEIIAYIKQNKREDDYIISYILDYIENHYAEDIYLNLFAEKLKLTGAYISSYFKEKMNVNLSDYVNNYRIKKAVELTENPQNKNKDIAVMVGLPNINTFIRLFKKYTGYTPGEYRKNHFGEK